MQKFLDISGANCMIEHGDGDWYKVTEIESLKGIAKAYIASDGNKDLRFLAVEKERDALRNTLVALAPDLKVMAILYQQQGQSQRAQALMAIRESLGLGE